MATDFVKKGYGQVEPNHLSAQRTGQIYAQLPWDAPVDGVLENGTFLKYDYAAGKANADTDSAKEWMLVYNEVKLYDKARQSYKDFALKVAEAVDGVVTPRLFKVETGDIFTTNNVVLTSNKAAAKGKYLAVTEDETNKVGVLTEVATGTVDAYQIVQVYTMPDGTDAVKVQYVGTVALGA